MKWNLELDQFHAQKNLFQLFLYYKHLNNLKFR